MDHYTVFPDGTRVCSLGQGTWNMGDNRQQKDEEIRTLRAGIDWGLTAIDTAEMYGNGNSELLVGEAIEGLRDKVFLISKVLPSNASYEGTKEACERSLKRLRTNYIDLYLLHWRSRYPLDETVRAMRELQAEGKIKQWGVSNFDVDDMDELYQSIEGGKECATDEILYNLSRRGTEYDLQPWCHSHKIPIIAYSPIEQGRILTNSALIQVAKKHGRTPAQIALAWVIAHTNVLAIPKAATLAHVKDNYESLTIKLDKEDNEMLDKAFTAPTRKVSLEVI